ALGVEFIHGVAVQAFSTENVFGLAGAGTASGLIGLSGAVTVAIVDSDTAAFVDQNANVNTDQTGANAAQSVNVSAANETKVFGLPVNIAGGLLTAGAGVDIGVIDNDTTARVNSGAEVHARQDIDVHALTRIEGDSFIAN